MLKPDLPGNKSRYPFCYSYLVNNIALFQIWYICCGSKYNTVLEVTEKSCPKFTRTLPALWANV